jgi:hypothetical protein
MVSWTYVPSSFPLLAKVWFMALFGAWFIAKLNGKLCLYFIGASLGLEVVGKTLLSCLSLVMLSPLDEIQFR